MSNGHHPEHETETLCVLLVEDSSTSALLAQTVLSETLAGAAHSYHLIHVETLAAALEALNNNTFDVILLDLNLPDSSGSATLSKVLAESPTAAVVVLTATDDEALGLNALKAGAQDYLIKDETYPKLLKRAISYAHERSLVEQAMRRARNKAEQANRAKSEFLSSMSHEFRTPMNAILGFGQMMKFDTASPLAEKHSEYVDIILRSGDHLLDLINDTLDLARIESGTAEISLEPLSFPSEALSCVDLISPLAEKRGIKIYNNVPDKGLPAILADSTRIKQVLINLLSNGVKYNSEGGDLTLDTKPLGEDWVRIEVTDTGAGIAEEDRERIFVAFARLEDEGSEIEGTGVGLAVTKELVERMGGRIGVDSTMGKGSTFWVEMPADPDHAGAIHKETNADHLSYEEKGYKLLYVEDNPANKMLIEKVVGRVKGAEFLWAENAEDGIKMARDKQPDVIVMDINLPGMNGIEALQVLQGIAETRDIPIIALSANAMPQDIERGMKAGFLRYLTKPIDINLFLKAVDGALKTGDWANPD